MGYKAQLSMDLKPGVIVGGNFRLESLIGAGGMGAVWKATDLTLRRNVAIKVLHTDLRSEPQLAERFQREARTLASVEHPGIVPIYSFLTLDDVDGRSCPAIVMAFVEGNTLSETIRRGGPMRFDVAMPILRSLVATLAFAHEKGIVHRDLKPQNILLEPRGSSTQVRVLDFGIAKSIAQGTQAAVANATQAGMLLGTPDYMSPEQITNPTAVDARADVWALTVTFFEMLTARLPFPGATPVETISRVLTASPLPASAMNPGLPPAIDGVFGRALSRSIEARPRTVQEFLSWLEGIAALPPTTAMQAVSIAPTQWASAPPPPAFTPNPYAPTPAPGFAPGYAAPQPFYSHPVQMQPLPPPAPQSSNVRFIALVVAGVITVLCAACIVGVALSDHHKGPDSQNPMPQSSTPSTNP